MDRQTDRQTNRQADRHMDKQTDRQRHRQADGIWTNRQAYIYKQTEIQVYRHD